MSDDPTEIIVSASPLPGQIEAVPLSTLPVGADGLPVPVTMAATHWRDTYHPGSFRGAAFVARDHGLSGGRRVAIHEFPGRDDPVTEDLGRAARSFRLSCHVIGSDYTIRRDALLDALEAEGPGLLIHPWHGSMMVNVLSFELTESTEDGGMATFSIDFAAAGIAVAASAQVDGKSAASAAADAITAAAPAAFAADFDISGTAEFVEQAAGDLVKGMAIATSTLAAVQGGIGPALRAFEAGLAYLPDNVASLMRAPLQLGHSIVGLIAAVGVLGAPAQRIATLTTLATYGRDETYVPARTPARQQEAANRDALLHLIGTAAMAETVRAVAVVPMHSHDEAAALRQRIADQLDDMATAAADAGRDDRAEDFDALRRALGQMIDARAGSLSRLYDHRPPRTEPALVIANRLYGARDVEARSGDIVARNAVRHPAFVPAGTALKVVAA